MGQQGAQILFRSPASEVHGYSDRSALYQLQQTQKEWSQGVLSSGSQKLHASSQLWSPQARRHPHSLWLTVSCQIPHLRPIPQHSQPRLADRASDLMTHACIHLLSQSIPQALAGYQTLCWMWRMDKAMPVIPDSQALPWRIQSRPSFAQQIFSEHALCPRAPLGMQGHGSRSS